MEDEEKMMEEEEEVVEPPRRNRLGLLRVYNAYIHPVGRSIIRIEVSSVPIADLLHRSSRSVLVCERCASVFGWSTRPRRRELEISECAKPSAFNHLTSRRIPDDGVVCRSSKLSSS